MDDWLEKDYSDTIARLHKENKELKKTIKKWEDTYLELNDKYKKVRKELTNARIEAAEHHPVGPVLTVEFDPKKHGLKRYAVYFYNPSAQQSQMYKTWAKNEFRAGRNFYRFYNWNYRDCIEAIYEI